MKYSLDSDAAINAWRDYPIEHFPKIWEWIEHMGKQGILGMSEVVFSRSLRTKDVLVRAFTGKIEPS